MTFSQVYLNGKERLKKAGIESPAFDAMALFESVFRMNRQTLAVHGNEDAKNSDIVVFNDRIQQRCARRPLQYILGNWPFLDLSLDMGEGVLIAREDTEVLVRTADEHLRGRSHVSVLDLCAGTGAVGLGLSSLMHNADVTCVEYYDEALRYLRRNIEKNKDQAAARAVQANVLEAPDETIFSPVDVILSNPPYIPTDVLETLQAEVQQEPMTALDGGKDGLIFYRVIAEKWTKLLRPGGFIALEVGEGQARDVAALLEAVGVEQIAFAQDFSGIDRVVYGTMRSAEAESN